MHFQLVGPVVSLLLTAYPQIAQFRCTGLGLFEL